MGVTDIECPIDDYSQGYAALTLSVMEQKGASQGASGAPAVRMQTREGSQSLSW